MIFSLLIVSGQEKDETLMMGRAEGELSAEQNYSTGVWFAGGLNPNIFSISPLGFVTIAMMYLWGIMR